MLTIALALGAVNVALLVAVSRLRFCSIREQKLIRAAIDKLASGNYDTKHLLEIEEASGPLANALRMLTEAMAEAKRVHDATHTPHIEAGPRPGRELSNLAEGSGDKITGLLRQLSKAAVETQACARATAQCAGETEDQSAASAQSVAGSLSDIQSVAASIEELAAAANDIGQQIEDSAHITAKALEAAKRTNKTVLTLAWGAQKIGDVVALINNIAGQTNLLALNATIEAARAGAAGRCFAVVASEVKALSAQTAQATKDISTQVGAIQSAIEEAVDAIQAIGMTIEEVHDIGVDVAMAATQQLATTQEIARSVAQAAQSTESLARSIGHIRDAANRTGSSAAQVVGTIGELIETSTTLSKEAASFLEVAQT
jgi:methyl-accepting chemotaxis protein